MGNQLSSMVQDSHRSEIFELWYCAIYWLLVLVAMDWSSYLLKVACAA